MVERRKMSVDKILRCEIPNRPTVLNHVIIQNGLKVALNGSLLRVGFLPCGIITKGNLE